MKLNDAEALQKARAKIEDPQNWWGAGDFNDRSETRCAVQALDLTAERRPAALLQQAARELYGANVILVNDRIGHEAVMRCYDRAIEMATVTVMEDELAVAGD